MPTRMVASCGAIASGLLVGLVAIGTLASGQAPAVDADSAWFADWPQRYAQLQVYQTTPPRKLEDAAKLEVFSWLKRDAEYATRHFQNTGTGLGEAFGDYYIDLVLFVVQLKDPRSIDALARVTDVSGRVSTTLAEFGELAVRPVLAQLRNPLLRDSILYTLGKFIEGSRSGRSHISESSTRAIRAALLEGARDASPTARLSAVNALKYFRRDPEIVRTLQQLASDDQYAVVRDPRSGEVTYPVRRAAIVALRELLIRP
jgi:hypothetical protein